MRNTQGQSTQQHSSESGYYGDERDDSRNRYDNSRGTRGAAPARRDQRWGNDDSGAGDQWFGEFDRSDVADQSGRFGSSGSGYRQQRSGSSYGDGYSRDDERARYRDYSNEREGFGNRSGYRSYNQSGNAPSQYPYADQEPGPYGAPFGSRPDQVDPHGGYGRPWNSGETRSWGYQGGYGQQGFQMQGGQRAGGPRSGEFARPGNYGSGDYGNSGYSSGAYSGQQGGYSSGNSYPNPSNYGNGGSQSSNYAGHGYSAAGGYAGADESSRGEFGGRTARSNSGAGMKRAWNRGPKGYTRSDERIREDISDQLMHSHEIDPSEVEIQVSGGEVTLTGTVCCRREKYQLEELAERVAGVKDVVNNVRIKRDAGSSSSTSDQTSDRAGSSSLSGSSSAYSSGGSSSGGTSSGATGDYATSAGRSTTPRKT